MATDRPDAGAERGGRDLADPEAASTGDEAGAMSAPFGREVDLRSRRRLDEVFGDLPTVTSDELEFDEPVRDGRPGAAAERELLENRPPHHDRD